MLTVLLQRLLLVAGVFGFGLALDAVVLFVSDLICSRRADPSRCGCWQPLVDPGA